MIVFRWQWRDVALPPHATLNILLFYKNKKTMLKKEFGNGKWDVWNEKLKDGKSEVCL